MNSTRRPGFIPVMTLLAVVATGLCLLHLDPEFAGRLADDAADLAAIRSDMESAQRTDRVLAKEYVQSRERLEVKEILIESLLQGRARLEEVTDRFLLLNRDFPGCMLSLRIAYPGKSDRESIARCVVAFARSRATGAFFDRLMIECRLCEDLRRLIGGSGAAHR